MDDPQETLPFSKVASGAPPQQQQHANVEKRVDALLHDLDSSTTDKNNNSNHAQSTSLATEGYEKTATRRPPIQGRPNSTAESAPREEPSLITSMAVKEENQLTPNQRVVVTPIKPDPPEHVPSRVEVVRQSLDQRESGENNNNNNNNNTVDGDDDDDVASKAAAALAAVAAAATANHKSPAEAAREARAAAQTFISTAKAADEPPPVLVPAQPAEERVFKTVYLSQVKAHVRQRAAEGKYFLADKYCQSDNDAFLQYLLLLEHFHCVEELHPEDRSAGPLQPPERGGDNTTTGNPVEASDRLESILRKVEGAYESLVNMLPAVPEPHHHNNTSSNSTRVEDEDFETPAIIPDLLPPCIAPKGDATVAFFRACVGDHAMSTLYSNSEAAAGKISSEETRSVADLSDTTSQETNSTATTKGTAAVGNKGGSVFSSMFKKRPSASKPFGGVFRKGSRSATNSDNSDDDSNRQQMIEASEAAFRTGEYIVKIERDMLGLTVENVLERTVVRTVAPGGPAKKAGARIGSLIVKVGNVETKNLTHFETIDELRQSNRPLQLVMRQISDDALRLAREEMGRLIRGSGFGTIMDSNRASEAPDASEGGSRPLIGADLRIDAYTNLIRRRLADGIPPPKNKRDEGLGRVSVKLVWILTLFAVGLEKEATRAQQALADPNDAPKRNPHHVYHYSAKDYADASRSVSKVLLDFSRRKIDPMSDKPQKARTADFINHSLDAAGGIRKGRKNAPMPPPPMPGRGGRGGRGGRRPVMVPGMSPEDDSSLSHEKPLLQIGDVLQRTRTFLADPKSPAAALLRGELIAFLCDLLDLDTDMELAEEETASATAGGKAGTIIDLGSAGSLLKLIVLNCPIMRSPGCEQFASPFDDIEPELEEELQRRFGSRDSLSAVDLHRLHAGNRFLAVVHRLAASRSTSARITACSLGPVLWGHLDFPHQLQLRGVITRALHDVEVIVRKATATVLHEIAELVFDPRSVPWLVLMCERAMTDPEPQLRSAAMTLTWHLAEHLPNAFLGDASQGSRYLQRLPSRDDPIFADVYLLQCKLLPVATRLAEDRSPTVRVAVAAQCDRLCDALGDHWSSVVIDVLHAMLSDLDEGVRCEAVACVPRLAEIVLLSPTPGETAKSEVSVLEALLPATLKLKKDTSSTVRVALATAAGELLILLVSMQSRVVEPTVANVDQEPSESSADSDEGGKRYKRQVDERLIPLLQTLLNDSDPEVTSAALRAVTNATRSSVQHSRARQVSVASEDDSVSMSSYHSHSPVEKHVMLPVLSELQVMRLLPTLTELSDSRQWRVRQSAVEIVPALLGCTKQLETRMEISKLCVRLMHDHVDAVRKTAAECLCMGGTSLGSHGEDASAEWISSVVIPTIRKCAIHTDSKQRLLSLKMVEVVLLSGNCPTKWKGKVNDKERMTDSPMRELAAISLSLTTDRIANVRLNVGRTLEAVLDLFEEEEVSFIREVLAQQVQLEKEKQGGGDRDVLYFAKRCVSRAKLILEEKQIMI